MSLREEKEFLLQKPPNHDYYPLSPPLASLLSTLHSPPLYCDRKRERDQKPLSHTNPSLLLLLPQLGPGWRHLTTPKSSQFPSSPPPSPLPPLLSPPFITLCVILHSSRKGTKKWGAEKMLIEDISLCVWEVDTVYRQDP